MFIFFLRAEGFFSCQKVETVCQIRESSSFFRNKSSKFGKLERCSGQIQKKLKDPRGHFPQILKILLLPALKKRRAERIWLCHKVKYKKTVKYLHLQHFSSPFSPITESAVVVCRRNFPTSSFRGPGFPFLRFLLPVSYFVSDARDQSVRGKWASPQIFLKTRKPGGVRIILSDRPDRSGEKGRLSFILERLGGGGGGGLCLVGVGGVWVG